MKVHIGPYIEGIDFLTYSDRLLSKKHNKMVYDIDEKDLTSFDKIQIKSFTLLQRFIGTPINKLYYNKKERNISVHIDSYDIWSMDHTLAHIIHPMLIKLKETKHGVPFVDNEDVPEELRIAEPTAETFSETMDKAFSDKWDWVLNEMIYAFESLKDNDVWEANFYSDFPTSRHNKKLQGFSHEPFYYDAEGHDLAEKRVNNALKLFGKYFRSLWD